MSSSSKHSSRWRSRWWRSNHPQRHGSGLQAVERDGSFLPKRRLFSWQSERWRWHVPLHGGRVAVIVTVITVFLPPALTRLPSSFTGGRVFVIGTFLALEIRPAVSTAAHDGCLSRLSTDRLSTFGIEIDLRIEMSEKWDNFEGSRLWAPTQQEPRGGDSTPATPLRAGPASAHGGGVSPPRKRHPVRSSLPPFSGTTTRSNKDRRFEISGKRWSFRGLPPCGRSARRTYALMLRVTTATSRRTLRFADEEELTQIPTAPSRRTARFADTDNLSSSSPNRGYGGETTPRPIHGGLASHNCPRWGCLPLVPLPWIEPRDRDRSPV